MSEQPDIAFVGSLLGDEARAAILSSLMDGRSLTARELAVGAGVTPQTASFHLNKLTQAGLLEIHPQGRHRFYRLASKQIRSAIEALLVAIPGSLAKPAAKRKNDVCFARTCYSHLAGYLGLAVTARLQEMSVIKAIADDDFDVLPKGESFFRKIGIDLTSIKQGRRLFARQCLDWSERQPHLGGALGQAFIDQLLKRQWLRKKRNGREIYVTDAGYGGFKRLLGIDVKKLEQDFFRS